jgi:AraC family transcriptional regulator
MTEDGVRDHIEELSRAIEYIEAHLDGPFRLAETAREAGMSAFHFSRVFASVTGEPASGYARKRRLTKAADRLLSSGDDIIDIAFDAGFDSQEAFTRAFRRWYGVPPARFRRRALPYMLRDTPALTRAELEALTRGDLGLEPRMEARRDAFFLGLSCMNGGGRIRIPRLWSAFLPRMGEVEGAIDRSTYGIYIYDFEAPTASIGEDFPFRYLAAMELAPDAPALGGIAGAARGTTCDAARPSPGPSDMETFHVEAADYAVFEHRGLLRDLGSTYRFIYKTWFPRQGAALAQAPFFERRKPDYPGDRPGALTEIWIPLRT